ncbi:amino acid ABC transporter ATP-binding protein [Helicobacter sp. T3_23-1056]
MPTPILKIANLKKSYDAKEVLKGINLELHKGEVLCLLGPSGCGKSSLLRCINGLETFEYGEIYLESNLITSGQNPAPQHKDLDSKKSTKTNWSKIRQDIGMVFQNYELFPHLSVEENISLAPIKVQKRDKKEVLEKAHTLLRRVGLESYAKSYPKTLSGGQKQRVAIVRALCMNPKILLLDEITASLDPEMVREVLDVVLTLADEGKTMMIVTHEMGFAKAVSDRIVFLDNGIIQQEDSPSEFFNNPKTPRAQKFLQSFDFKPRKNLG